MQNKAQAAGLHPSGIPVIDFRGHMVMGFNPSVLSALIQGSGGQGQGSTRAI